MSRSAAIQSNAEYLTKSQVQDLLQVSRTTVDRAMAAGQLKYFKVGNGSLRGPVRFRKADVEQYVNSLVS